MQSIYANKKIKYTVMLILTAFLSNSHYPEVLTAQGKISVSYSEKHPPGRSYEVSVASLNSNTLTHVQTRSRRDYIKVRVRVARTLAKLS